MKHKMIFPATAFLFIISGFIYINPETNNSLVTSVHTASAGDTVFRLGAMNTINDDGNYYKHYDSVGFNFWHSYISTAVDSPGRDYPLGIMHFSTYDSLFRPVSEYSSTFHMKMDTIYSHNSSRMVLHRPKIEWLCYGQRSDYQCEATHIDTMLWFYAFNCSDTSHTYTGQTVQDNSSFGSGAWVKRCLTNPSFPEAPDNPGYVVDRLKANGEQSRVVQKGYNTWQGDSECDWLIKPSIRIDSTVADNSQNLNMIVCKIVILNGAGNNLLTTHLRVRHFTDGLGNYDGRYLEEFRYETGDTALTISGAWGTSWIWDVRGNQTSESGYNLADIQVYWFGECDMWIDYVRVDNDIAHRLLGSTPDVDFEQWMEDEVEQIGLYTPSGASEPAGYKFYVELTEFNNIPCMAYVNRRLKYYSSQYNGGADTVDLMADWYLRYSAHVPWGDRQTVMNAEHIKRFWIDSVGFTMFFAECYPFNSSGEVYDSTNFAKIPNTLPVHSCGGLTCGIMADDVSPVVFDDWLQDNLDHEPYYFSSDVSKNNTEYYWSRGSFRFIMKLGNEISRTRGIPFIHMPQAHSLLESGVETHNEPTNEEIDLQANLSVSYGVRGLLYFAYPSGGNAGTNGYTRGIADTNIGPNGYVLRLKNVYEQDTTKKKTFINISNRLNAWQTHLMHFRYDSTNSYTYYIEGERNSLLDADNSYFKDVISYKYGSGVPPCSADDPGIDAPENGYELYECNEHRYLQVATFQKSQEDGNQYFIVVNRRCSPLQSSHNDGQRNVVVIFHQNSAFFPTYTTWEIIDLASNTQVGTFKKTLYNQTVDLGLFNPGEGKLYKIAPVN